MRKRSIQKEKKAKTSLKSYKKNLYLALTCLYQFRKREDFLFLKDKFFLDICEVRSLSWKLDKKWLEKETLEESSPGSWPFQFSCPLTYKEKHYGELIFFSSHKFLQNHKRFLKKISFFTASTFYCLENKEVLQNFKRQWAGVFNSFSQAFCITNKNLEIIRYNQPFLKISNQKESEIRNQNLFKVFPIPRNLFKESESEGSFLFKEARHHWKVSFKTLLLRRENTQAFLFLIKDMTKEMEIEEKLSFQAKERELGFIKGSIAHELNNPIAGIQLLLEVLGKNVPQNRTFVMDSLKEMKKSVQTCQEIIHKILLVSKDKRETAETLELVKNL